MPVRFIKKFFSERKERELQQKKEEGQARLVGAIITVAKCKPYIRHGKISQYRFSIGEFLFCFYASAKDCTTKSNKIVIIQPQGYAKTFVVDEKEKVGGDILACVPWDMRNAILRRADFLRTRGCRL